GGAQLHDTPGKGTPSKFACVPGIAAVTGAVAPDCTTVSLLSLCECGIFGLSFASRSGLNTIGNCFMSRSGGDLSLCVDAPTITLEFPWGLVSEASAARARFASITCGNTKIAITKRVPANATINFANFIY